MPLQPGFRFRRAGRASVEGVLVLVALHARTPLVAQVTRPERTDFGETSSYADVLSFLDSLQRVASELRVGTLAVSAEGRRVPFVLASHPLVSSPAEAHRSGKLIVYLQANIHAGEVEGKEASQMLLRDLMLGPLRPLLAQIVLLVVPIYNTDGNERMAAGEENRPGQNGPARVGRNANGQGLNLNRDYVKMEAPETRGAASLLSAWDPDIFIDLHTTNGSYHGYVLTYAPGLNPNSNPAADFVRDRFLPAMRERMQRRHRQRTFPYGNFRNQDPDSLEQGWETYDARPRFGTNWMGLRGRVAVLSEGYSNADFRTRTAATYDFVREVLALAVERRATIKSLIQASDRQRPDSVSVRSVLGPSTVQEVIAEITEPAGDGAGGFARRKRTGVYRGVRMPVFDRFVAARREAIPAGYIIPQRLHEIVELLRRHNVVVESLTKRWRTAANLFRIDSVVVQPLFEGHRTVQVEGRWRSESFDTTLVPGWYLVRTDQSLGVLASYLLEPASEDGVLTWNLLDRELSAGATYPILRLNDSPGVPATTVP
jgi:zinc carboxypeptidase